MLEPQLGTSIEEVGALPIWSKIPKIPVWEKMENAFFSVCPTRKLEKKKKKSGTAQKVVPFSRWERPDWFSVFQLQFFTSPRPTAMKLSPLFRKKAVTVTSNLSETDLVTSEFDINQTNANTWHWTGIGSLPKQFPSGIIPVAATSLSVQSIQCIYVPLVIRK